MLPIKENCLIQVIIVDTYSKAGEFNHPRLHFGSKNTGKISIISVFFFRNEALTPPPQPAVPLLQFRENDACENVALAVHIDKGGGDKLR